MTGKELAVLLRKQAEVIEKLPDRFWVNESRIGIGCKDKESVAEVARSLGGEWEKEASDIYFYLNRTVGDCKDAIYAYAERKVVCERVKVGEKVVPAQPETLVPATPERVEEVYKWVCPDSILS